MPYLKLMEIVTLNKITSGGVAACAIHFHAHDQALEFTEVVADKMSR